VLTSLRRTFALYTIVALLCAVLYVVLLLGPAAILLWFLAPELFAILIGLIAFGVGVETPLAQPTKAARLKRR